MGVHAAAEVQPYSSRAPTQTPVIDILKQINLNVRSGMRVDSKLLGQAPIQYKPVTSKNISQVFPFPTPLANFTPKAPLVDSSRKKPSNSKIAKQTTVS